MKNIAVFISGSGTDMQSIIDAINDKKINGKIQIVLSSNENAYGLTRAKNYGIDTVVYNKKNFASLDLMYDEVVSLLKSKEIDLIVLAGYLTILTPNIVKAFKNRIINIHPALIPAFCGKGFYGMKVHEAVVEYGVKVSGATVHFVDEIADNGAIIMQDVVSVSDTDKAEDVQRKVLELEHKLLPKAVAMFCDDKLVVDGRIVRIFN